MRTKQIVKKSIENSGCRTANEFAVKYGFSRGNVYNYLNGKRVIDESKVDLFAECSGIDAEYLTVLLAKERCERDGNHHVLKYWDEIIKKWRPSASVFLVFALGLYGGNAEAASVSGNYSGLTSYILCE